MRFCEDYKSMVENIVHQIYLYITLHDLRSMIIGESGGVDSTVCSALANEAIKKIGGGVKLIGRSLPIYSKEDEMLRANNTGRIFCDEFEVEHLEMIFNLISKTRIRNDKYDKIRAGNIKARSRMIWLFDLAKEYDGLVLSTDNWTEFLLGFWTLHGDVGNLGPIQELWKTEVYGIAEYLQKKYEEEGDNIKALIMKDSIEAIPTDGLGVSDSDFDQILINYDKTLSPRENYNIIDKILQEPKEERNMVWHRRNASEYKRSDPYNIPREVILMECDWSRK